MALTDSCTLSIGVDARSLCGPLSGIGHYVFETLKGLSSISEVELHLYCAPCPPQVSLPASWKVRSIRLPRQVAIKLVFGRWAQLDKVDVFWAPQTILPLGKFPKVATVHDLNHILVPETMSWGTSLAHRIWFDKDVNRADRIIANSSGTAGRLMSHLGRRANAVALPGTQPEFSPLAAGDFAPVVERYNLTPGYLLSVGTLEPRKNILTLMKAHASLFSLGQVPELVLVGRMGWGKSVSAESFPGVRLLGYVGDRDLPALYNAAGAFVIPSLYEGYGMPAAEARACGVRVMATDIPELREAAGPDAIFVSADEGSIRQGLLQVLSQNRPSSAEVVSSWKDTAEHYLKQFISVAGKS